MCGAQWSVDGSDLEQVSDGDGYCDDNARGLDETMHYRSE